MVKPKCGETSTITGICILQVKYPKIQGKRKINHMDDLASGPIGSR
jgi:hypothetical protein